MISESGPPRWPSEDDTPTQNFEAIRDEPDAAGREEHGLTALLARDERSILPPRTRERRTVKLTAALGVIVLAVIGVSTYEVVSHSGKTTTVTAAHTRHTGPSAAAASPSALPTASQSATASASAPATPASSAPAPPVRTLRPVSAIAVGPAGRTGDDPQGAAQVLTGAAQTPWSTDWYTTSLFGGLQTGTGLLLDLGSEESVSTVGVTLGDTPGADFQVRAGQTPSPADMRVVATSAGHGGTVQLSFAHPAQARYLLIWFTKLPPSGTGTYQVKVYRVTVRGQSG